MPADGLTPAGFVVRTFTTILQRIQNALLASPAFGPEIDLSPTSPEGQLTTTAANMLSELWELVGLLVSQFSPNNAEGAMQDNIGAIRGIPREGASATEVLCTLTISAADAPYAIGSLVASVQGSPGYTFDNDVIVTSAMISGGIATGVLFVAQTPGASATVNPNTLTNIVNPVTGWTAITNPLAQSEPGTNEELDSAYIARQTTELATKGSCNPPSTQANVYAFLQSLYAAANNGQPFAVNLYNNTSLSSVNFGTATSPYFVPGKSFAVVVYDPASLAPQSGPAAPKGAAPTSLAAAIWQNDPAGISSFGTTTGTVTDPVLGQQPVSWSYPTGLPLFLSATIAIRSGFTWGTPTTPGSVYASILAALVAAAVAPTPASGVAPTGQLLPGTSVVQSQLEAVIMSVPGVFDVQVLTFGFSASPVNTAPLVVSPLQVPTISSTTVASNVLLTQGALP